MRPYFLGRYVAPEMLALWIVEVVLTFILSMILVTPATASLNLAAVNPAIVYALTAGFTAFIIGTYRSQIFLKVHTLIKSTLLVSIMSFPAVWVVCKIVGLSEYLPIGYDSLRPIKIIALWSISLLVTRLMFMAATRNGLFVHRVGLLELEASSSSDATLKAGRKGFLEISAVHPEQASVQQLGRARIRTLVVSRDCQTQTSLVKKEYLGQGITLQSEAEFWEQSLRRINIANLELAGLTDFNQVAISQRANVIGRGFDILLSLGLLLSTLPIMIIVAILVRLDSAGSILYKQERVGLNGIGFTLLKFRSMKRDAEAGGPRWAQKRDPRVTRLGSFMRKTRIDELPQLFNILRGEMSFIGPRPERPHFVDQLETLIPYYRVRCWVKPGLTGWAQVNYPYGASIEDARAKLSYDLYYVKNRGVFLDFLILLSTVRVILLQEGAR